MTTMMMMMMMMMTMMMIARGAVDVIAGPVLKEGGLIMRIMCQRVCKMSE